MAPAAAGVMIASLRGVLVLVALALALGVVVAVDTLRAPAVEDRALAPGFDGSRVAAIDWRLPDGTTYRITREGTSWSDGAHRVDAGAVDAVLATLRGGRWHRRRERDAATATTARVQVTFADRRTTTFAIGPALAGTEQVWLVRGDDELLVDGWIARALVPEPWMLLPRRPFADGSARTRHDIDLAGARFSIAGGRRDGVWVAPSLVAELARAVAELTFVGRSQGPAARVGAAGLAITVGEPPDTRSVRGSAPCLGHPELVALETSVGDACVTAASWAAVEAAARALAQPQDAIVDRRPLPVAARRLALADGTLTLGKTSAVTIAGVPHPVDADRTTELLAALETAGERVPAPAAKPATTIVANDGEVTLELHAPDLVVRREDGIALRIGTGAWEILARSAARYRDRTLWREEPTTIIRVELDGTIWERGDVLGEWRVPGGASRSQPTLEAYVVMLARLRGRDADPPRGFAVMHRVTLVVAPPGARAPTTHVLELGAPVAGGCPVRAAGREILAPRETCTLPAPK